ncbi:SRPBCC family protein [Streptomyces sp. NPDC060194]|uniref:SRPBCC family protein n=1 Tax=Streptomyces sp. NPDC060194 TaxID=3347069 RepID=UPI00366431AD
MASVILRVAGAADADEVWRRYVTPACWPSWSPQIRSVRTDGDRVRGGARGEVRGHLGVRARFVVDSVDEEARTWVWRVRVGPLRMRLHHEVRPRPGGTLTTLRIDGAAPVVAAYALPARWALTRLVRP